MDKAQKIPHGNDDINLILNEVANAKAVLIIAHGAGASMHHHFLNSVVSALNKLDISCVRFNFPYMDQGKKFPGNPNVNIAAWKSVLQWGLSYFQLPMFICGKSYGGRMASHLLAECSEFNVMGIMYLGFPLHAPGKPALNRANHLNLIASPQLFFQGTNDSLADFRLINQVISSLPKSTLCSIEGADHSFKVKGKGIEQTINEIATNTLNWIEDILVQKNTNQVTKIDSK